LDGKVILKHRQQEVFDYIKKCIYANGFPPSVREIAEAVGLKSSSAAHAYLLQLEKAGFIRRDPSKTRAIFLNEGHSIESPQISLENNSVHLPLLGSVAAGIPIFAEQNIEYYIPVATDLLGSGNHFLLKVKGDSMIEAGILDGDFLIVKEQSDALNGDIVVALLNEDATVKQYYKKGRQIELRPANSSFSSIFIREVYILGKVTGLMRKI
jgi:repressor LexA